MPTGKDIFFLHTEQTPWEGFGPDGSDDYGRVRWLARPGQAKGVHRAAIWQGPMPPRTQVTYPQAETVFITRGSATIETDDGDIHHLVAGDAMLFDVGSTIYWTCSDDYEELFIFSGGDTEADDVVTA